MRICVPTVNERGLAAGLSPHFGRAPWFTIVDAESGEVSLVRNGAMEHEHGGCAPIHLFSGQGVAAVVCRGLGRGAHARLRAAGMRVYVTGSDDVAGVLAEWRAGRLLEAGTEELCQGQGQGHGHGHGHTH